VGNRTGLIYIRMESLHSYTKGELVILRKDRRLGVIMEDRHPVWGGHFCGVVVSGEFSWVASTGLMPVSGPAKEWGITPVTKGPVVCRSSVTAEL